MMRNVEIDFNREGLYSLHEILLREFMLGELAFAGTAEMTVREQIIRDTIAACVDEFVEVTV